MREVHHNRAQRSKERHPGEAESLLTNNVVANMQRRARRDGDNAEPLLQEFIARPPYEIFDLHKTYEKLCS
jgi:hypothetical protein